MEWYKKLTILLTMLFTSIMSYAQLFPQQWVPMDPVSLELMISYHKLIGYSEDIAIGELALIEGEHIETNKFVKNCKEVRDFLNQKLADFNSSIILGAQFLQISNDVKNVIVNYKDFAKNTFSHVKDHPFLAAYFATTTASVEMEGELLAKKIAQFAAGYETNIAKSSMKEKKQLLDIIAKGMAKIHNILWNANLTCKCMIIHGIKEYNIQAYLNNGTNKKIMDKVITKWKQMNSQRQSE